MKTFSALGWIGAVAIVMVVGLQSEQGVSYTSGAPSGRTGSPGDGGWHCATSGCHASNPGTPSGAEMIALTSDVPASGYIPGNTYEFTATMTDSTVSKFGFQISPQNVAGDILGTLIAGPETGLVGLGGYVTHTFVNTLGDGMRSWDFSWTAPVQGTGDVTFYGAYNFCNNNGQTSGDVILLMDTTIQENITTGVADAANKKVIAYPNPSNGTFRLDGISGQVSYQLFSLSGSLVSTGYASNSMVSLDRSVVSQGSYVMKVVAGNEQHSTRILIQ